MFDLLIKLPIHVAFALGFLTIPFRGEARVGAALG
jgi:hypothetical protein